MSASSPHTPTDTASALVSLGARARVRFWRSLEEANGTPPPDVARHDVLAPLAYGRRDFMKLMGASLALAGTAGCSRAPLEPIVPYRDGPAQQTYGKPVFYTSALPRDGYGVGVLVETNMGRPTKVEGNPEHPASRGATDVFLQASVLELWDPDRSQAVRGGRTIATWNDFLGAVEARLRTLRAREGRSLRILTETVTSPSLYARIRAVLDRYPGAQWHQWQPLNDDQAHAGASLAYGEVVDTLHRFDRARTVVAFDGDFLDDAPGFVRYALDFATTRHAHAPAADRSRLYAFECAPSLTGAAADHRVPLRASAMEAAAVQVAAALSGAQPAGGPIAEQVLRAIVADLHASAGASIVTAGRRQPPRVHALAHAINARLGNVGKTVFLVPPVAVEPVDHAASLAALVDAMRGGAVDLLLVLEANPVYTAPADLAFVRALENVPLKVHCGVYADETAVHCDWHVPLAHPLERWGDLRAFDGTLALQQPCLAPLYDGKSPHEVLAALAGDATSSNRALVRAHWHREHPGDVDAFLEDALRRGVVPGSAPAAVTPRLREETTAADTGAASGRDTKGGEATQAGDSADAIELVFVPDPRAGDGRHANNAWLQELPKPLSQLTWENAAFLAPALAQRLGIANEDVVLLRAGQRQVEAPAWIVPGMPDRSITVALGYGRTAAGAVGNRRGFDAYALRTRETPWHVSRASVTRTGRRHALACAQTHHTMEGRDLLRVYTASQAQACTADACGTPHFREAHTLYTTPPTGPYAWAMSVDLSACIGCGACTIACQAENNIPVVGKDEVRNGREMHWIRVDRYYEGAVDAPRTLFQPVPCMQCEHAPCEVVCPVEASVHDAQGINVQVYNRCVGTRFCSNNCPYKVRRFNFLQYSEDVPGLDAQRNPEVTVRMRGVMEKCNYCLQRITTAKIAADVEGRRIQDGEVVTACQAVCPTRAIVFGDLADPASEVRRRKDSPLDYALLAELNTRPRTTYLARVTNPSTDLSGSDSSDPRAGETLSPEGRHG
ncbi:MAG: Fe-S-cluster-containing hydrogenase [Rudaea sp.]